MIRLSLRQFRAQGIVAGVLLVVFAVLFAITGPHLAHLYDVASKAQAACIASANCGRVTVNIGHLDKFLELIGTALVVVPALVGAFWGAPLVAREFENGTQRLAWTQSVTRTRWLAVKLAVAGTASIAVTGLLSLMVTWWSSPLDGFRSNRFGIGIFGERNIVPIGYAAFGFALGVVAGLLIRRTLPAMAATLGAFLAVRLAFSFNVRPWLLSPLHLSQALNPATMGFGRVNAGPDTLMPAPPNLPNAWIYSTRIVDDGGHSLTQSVLTATCPQLNAIAFPPPVSSGGTPPPDLRDTVIDCATKISAKYHEAVTYQPGSRYWALQWYEMSIYLAAAVALAGFAFWWVRRRAS